MSDHRCNGHETEALREFLFVEFVSPDVYEIYTSNGTYTSNKPILLKPYFFGADEDSNFPCFQISGRGHTHREIQTCRLNTFSTSQSVVFIMVSLLESFSMFSVFSVFFRYLKPIAFIMVSLLESFSNSIAIFSIANFKIEVKK